MSDIYLVGFRFNSESENPDYYALTVCNDYDYYLCKNQNIILFDETKNAQKAFKLSDNLIHNFNSIPESVCYVYEISNAIYILESENADFDSDIINCINAFGDILDSTGLTWPKLYRDQLYKIAEHLTFRDEFASFLEKEKISRDLIIDSFMWSTGAMFTNALFV